MIIFLFGYKQTGGVPRLFYNIGSELNRRSIAFRLICYEDSEIFKAFSKSGISFGFIPIESLSKPGNIGHITKNDILIITYFDPVLKYLNKINPRVLFYNVFPDYLIRMNTIHGKYRLDSWTRRLLIIMKRKVGLVLMDDSACYEFDKQLGFKTPYPIVPLPIHIDSENAYFNKEQINITFIGRAEIWKVLPAIKIYEEIREFVISHQISFTIITENKESFIRIWKNYETEFELESIIWKENLSFNDLNKYLITSTSIGISMGYSALETAKLGIPTLIVSPSYDINLKNIGFKWIYKTKKGNLGSFNNLSDYNVRLNDIVKGVLLNSELMREYSSKSFHYVLANHSLEKTVDLFMNNMHNSKMYLSDVLNKVWSYSFLYIVKRNFKKLWYHEL